MEKPTTEASKSGYSTDLLLHSAKGFLDIGYHLAREGKNDNGIKGLQRLAASVVNFSFAAELFLKGLIFIIKDKPSKTHKLDLLFESLPSDIKSEIESNFQEERENLDENLSAYKAVSVKGEGNESTSEKTEILNVKDLLILHNNSFQHWRYIYEVPHEGYQYEYNFQLMHAFLKVIIDKINQIRQANFDHLSNSTSK
jgi:hypothetical protein